ncbi:MAG: DUF1573 domain-containing protein [Phycisphaerae bacterium]|nr:DUF1573 domain-containing protein [Phycisphaerae bacterium]
MRFNRSKEFIVVFALVALGSGVSAPAHGDDQPAADSNAGATTKPASSPPPDLTIPTTARKVQNDLIPKPTVVLKPGETPKPQFEDAAYSYGTVRAGTVIEHEFKFKNTGTGPLEILAVRPGCGCTTSGEFDKILAPGATGRIPVKMSTARFSGSVTKTVAVHTNAPGVDGLIVLTLNGTVNPLIVIEPTKVEFGSLKLTDVAGKTLTGSFTITNQIEDPLELKDLTSSNPNFKAEMKELEPGRKFEVVVTMGGALRTGSNGANIDVNTNFPDMATIRVPAAVYLNSPVDVMPSQVTLPATRATAMTRALFVRNNTVVPVKLSGLKSSNPKLGVRLEETTPGMAWKLVLDVPVDYQSAPNGDTVSVKTSNPEIPELIVDVITREMNRPLPPGMPTSADSGQIGGAVKSN